MIQVRCLNYSHFTPKKRFPFLPPHPTQHHGHQPQTKHVACSPPPLQSPHQNLKRYSRSSLPPHDPFPLIAVAVINRRQQRHHQSCALACKLPLARAPTRRRGGGRRLGLRACMQRCASIGAEHAYGRREHVLSDSLSQAPSPIRGFKSYWATSCTSRSKSQSPLSISVRPLAFLARVLCPCVLPKTQI